MAIPVSYNVCFYVYEGNACICCCYNNCCWFVMATLSCMTVMVPFVYLSG